MKTAIQRLRWRKRGYRQTTASASVPTIAAVSGGRAPRATAILLAAIIATGLTSLLLVTPVQPAHAEDLGQWTPATSYPANISSQSCVASGGYIYCLGDQFQAGSVVTDYAPILSSGALGAWTSTSTQPSSAQFPVAPAQCVASGGYMYCLAGSSAIFAQLSASGVGAWTSTTSLPTVTISTPEGNFTGPTQVDSCAVSGGYIYCTTAVSSFAGNQPAAPVYFASLSSSGIGAWTATTAYPLTVQYLSCAASNGYIYCVGGQSIQFDGETVIPNIASVYFAQVLHRERSGRGRAPPAIPRSSRTNLAPSRVATSTASPVWRIPVLRHPGTGTRTASTSPSWARKREAFRPAGSPPPITRSPRRTVLASPLFPLPLRPPLTYTVSVGARAAPRSTTPPSLRSSLRRHPSSRWRRSV